MVYLLKKLILRNIDCRVKLPFFGKEVYRRVKFWKEYCRFFSKHKDWLTAQLCYVELSEILNSVPDNATVDVEDESDVHNQYYWWFSRVPDKLIEEYIKSNTEK